MDRQFHSVPHNTVSNTHTGTVLSACVRSFSLTLHGHIVNGELQALPTAHHLHRVPFIVIQFVPCEQSLRSFTCIENGAKSHTAVSCLSYQDDTQPHRPGALPHTCTNTDTHSWCTDRTDLQTFSGRHHREFSLA